jgi:hypothetical protein
MNEWLEAECVICGADAYLLPGCDLRNLVCPSCREHPDPESPMARWMLARRLHYATARIRRRVARRVGGVAAADELYNKHFGADD